MGCKTGGERIDMAKSARHHRGPAFHTDAHSLGNADSLTRLEPIENCLYFPTEGSCRVGLHGEDSIRTSGRMKKTSELELDSPGEPSSIQSGVGATALQNRTSRLETATS